MRASGVVKWFNHLKGWGFIDPGDGDGDIFLHRSQLNGLQSVTEGVKVTFEIEQRPKGRQAVNVLPA